MKAPYVTAEQNRRTPCPYAFRKSPRTLAASALTLLLSAGLAVKASAQTWTLQWSDEFNAAAGTLRQS